MTGTPRVPGADGGDPRGMHDEIEDRRIARALGMPLGDIGADDDADGAVTGTDDGAVAEYEHALSYLAPETEPPEGLEDRIVALALERRPAAVPALDRARAARAERDAHDARGPATTREGTRRRSGHAARWATLGATVAAAAAVVVFALAGGDDGSGGVDARLTADAADAPTILDAPGTRDAALVGIEPVGRVALATDGEGVLYDLALPDPGDRTYHVWLRAGDEDAHLGALVPPGPVRGFTVSDAAAVDRVIVTLESEADPAAPGDVVAAADL